MKTIQPMKKSSSFLSIAIITLTILSSCSFNGQFYHPMPINTPFSVPITQEETNDTLFFMQVESREQAPLFVTPKGDTATFDYSIENVLFTNAESQSLHGWFIAPAESIQPKATLLFLHGNGGNIISYLSFVFPFVKRGYQAFIFDYSGYGFSEGKPNRKSVLSSANAAVQLISKRNDVKNSPLLIYGQSLGGHLSPEVANQNRNAIDGVIIEGAFSSHKDIAAQSAGFFGRVLVKEAYPAKHAVKELTIPILVIHSTNDSVIPFTMGKKLYERANEPKLFFEIDGYHICGPLSYADEIDEKIDEILNSKR